jgi:hypothetical protein
MDPSASRLRVFNRGTAAVEVAVLEPVGVVLEYVGVVIEPVDDHRVDGVVAEAHAAPPECSCCYV